MRSVSLFYPDFSVALLAFLHGLRPSFPAPFDRGVRQMRAAPPRYKGSVERLITLLPGLLTGKEEEGAEEGEIRGGAV